MLVFVICWLLNIYGYLLVSASLLAAYYQHACQRFALTLKLLLYCILIRTFRYSIPLILRRPCFLSLALHNSSIILIVYFVNYCKINDFTGCEIMCACMASQCKQYRCTTHTYTTSHSYSLVGCKVSMVILVT